MIDFNDHIITQSSSILKALECINNIKGAGHLHVLFIRDIDDKIIGALTDGDIRRALIRGVSINENATTIMHKGFKFVNNNTDVIKAFHEFRDQDIYLVPRLSENGALLELIDLKEILSILPVECLIMAGGQGKRLLPLTEKTPKPLLKVGGKPIIEYNIERLQKFGVKNIHISVKYLGNQIKEYFGNGSSRGLSIRYVDETLELGTAGAVSLLPTICHPVLLLMNSDLLTNVDFEKMYLDFEKENADMIVATVPYTVKVPDFGLTPNIWAKITKL